jgi:hypothetical protein
VGTSTEGPCSGAFEKLPSWAKERPTARDPETGFLYPRNCGSFHVGHSVHYIQGLRSHSESHREGRLIGVGSGTIAVDFGDNLKFYRNHETDRLVEIIGLGKVVRVCERYSILREPVRNGHSHCFSIQRPNSEWRLCDDTPLISLTPHGLAGRALTHGGFLVPIQSIRGHH